MNSTRSLLGPAYRVAIKEHVVDRWTVPAATFKLCAPDETAARLMATRAAHRSGRPERPRGPRPSVAAGVWERLHHELLRRLNAAGQIDWSRGIVDSSQIRALQGGPHRALAG